MKNIHSIAVFCASSSGNNPIYQEAARSLGALLAYRSINLVYGGGKVGLMGILADEVLKHNGTVTGVIPRFLIEKEVAHENVTELIVTQNMHQRKAKMAVQSDAYIALPGGFGTLEEFFEMITWAQLGLHQKPLGLLNVEGFFDPLLNMLDIMIKEGFVKEENRSMIKVHSNAEALLQAL